MDIDIITGIGTIGTAFATIALVILLYKAIKQMESTVQLSKLQSEFRFRPWVGPNGGITELSVNANNQHQFDVGLKNYGEIPAEYVKAYSKQETKLISKSDLKLDNLESFNLGPMLPNMEKHYWIFIDAKKIEDAKEGKEKIFLIIYFEYPVSGGKSGYGMISEYIPEKNIFHHKEMWVDTPSGRTTHK